MILGIDPSSKKLAVAYGNGGSPKLWSWTRPSPNEPFSAPDAYAMYDAFSQFMLQQAHYTVGRGMDYCCIEAPVVGRGGAKPTIVQSFASGALQVALIEWGFLVNLVQNTTWKKEVCGSGNADKALIAATVRSRWVRDFNAADGDQDLLDAICIYHYARSTVPSKADVVE